MKNNKIVTCLAIGVALAAIAPAASIDFNEYPSETHINNQYAAQGVLFSTRTGTNVFDSSITGYIGFVGVNTPAIVNSPDAGLLRETRQQFLVIDFLVPVYDVLFDYANMGAPTFNFILPDAFKAYDANGVLLQTRTNTAASFNALEAISFTASGISKIELEAPAAQWVFAMDNLSFTQVPEPATVTAMVGGLVLIALLKRR